MGKIKIWLIFGLFVCALVIASLWYGLSNSIKDDSPVRIATNPWPGYEYLHLAEKKGFFKEEGLNIELVRFTSLEDARRAFELHKVDGMTSTLIELLQANEHGVPGKIVIVTDFSNGADMIIARNGINSVADLKGKTIGVEPATLSAFIVSRALNKAGLSLEDIKTEGLNPLNMEDAIISGKVDAVHTYPPVSLAILKHTDKTKKIFDSTQMPKEIIDVVSVNADIAANHKDVILALQRVWDKAKSYADSHPDEANKIMADLESISADEFTEALKGIKILNISEQKEILNDPLLTKTIKQVADVLKKGGELKKDIPDPEEFLINSTAERR